jgi:hypothetical protein
MAIPHDLTGKRFGMLTAIKRNPKQTKYNTAWFVRCDCGTVFSALAGNLKSGRTKTCGCKQSATTHGMSKTKEHRTWNHIKQRCQNPNAVGYERYGGAGIEVCKEWSDSFEQFFADMGKAPSDKHTIERVDNSRGYSPDNCRWATRLEQMQNVSTNRNITFNGKTMSVAAWAREIGVSESCLYNRLHIGMSIDKALTKKQYPWRTNFTHNGTTKPASEWCKESGTTQGAFTWRIKNGWSIHDAIFTPMQNGGRKKQT